MAKENHNNNCRICNSRLGSTILSGLKTRLGEVYSIKKCDECSFLTTYPVPSAKTLKQYYNQDYWQRFNNRTGRFLTLFFKLRMSGIIRDIKKSVPPKGRILDWGTGDGSLLALIDRAGYESYGIDAYSLNSNQKNLYKCDILDAPFKDEFFDAITCFHVLEHIEKPVPALEKAMRLLKPKGTLVVEVPNIDSFAFQIFRENWYPLDIPVHLNHFSLEVLQRLIDIANKNRIIKVDYFSHKQSPSAVLLSIFPYISPPRVRARYSGRFPLPLMLLYLFLQMVVYPFPIVEALVQRGEVIRIYVQKM